MNTTRLRLEDKTIDKISHVSGVVVNRLSKNGPLHRSYYSDLKIFQMRISPRPTDFPLAVWELSYSLMVKAAEQLALHWWQPTMSDIWRELTSVGG